MDIYWLEQRSADVPKDSAWLCCDEAAQAQAMLFSKRRSDWVLGRWTAKNAFCSFLGMDPDFKTLARIRIRATECGSPEVLYAGDRADVEISLSHSSQIALCVLGPRGVEIGCDLEAVEPRSAEFVEEYLTVEEQASIAAAPIEKSAQLVNILWSAKESVLKALHVGLRESTRCVRILSVSSGAFGGTEDDSWYPLLLSCADGRLFRGVWRQAEGLVRTVVHPVEITAQMVSLQAADHLRWV